MKKKTKKTEEEIELEHIGRQIVELKREYHPFPPSVIEYKVGDRVQHGAWDESFILEMTEDKRFYLLKEKTTAQRYGKPIVQERKMWVAWTDICPWRSKEDVLKVVNFSNRNFGLFQLGFSQREVAAIFSMYYHFGIDINPDYQRGNVWSPEDKTALIDSIFKGVDIGKFVFVSLPYKDLSPAYEVLDGKQRIIALTEFYESRFQFKGKYFHELSFADQHSFERHPIAFADIKNEDVKLSDKYKYFLLLNVSGKPQDKKHLREVEELYNKAIAEGK